MSEVRNYKEKLLSHISLEERTKNHPCYSGGCQNARIHLPVAPACNIACNYCNRKFDCVNESRPGVTSQVLNPEQAFNKFLIVKEKLNNLKVVGIAGPGDALANFNEIKRTFELIRQVDQEVTFCLSTNGLNLPRYARELARLGVTHVTVTINAIDPDIGSRIYREVNYEGVKYTGREASEILLQNQLEGLKHLQEHGIVAKVNTVMIKGINDNHIEAVARKVREYGVFIGNIMQLIPAPGSAFEYMPLTTKAQLNELRRVCGKYLKQMYHCQQCRADAIGTLSQDCSAEFVNMLENDRKIHNFGDVHKDKDNKLLHKNAETILIAVATGSGKLIDKHFGQTSQFAVYRYNRGELCFLEYRNVNKYCSGVDECGDYEDTLNGIIKAVDDCHIILSQRIGYQPKKLLESKGKTVLQCYGYIEEEILKAAEVYSCK